MKRIVPVFTFLILIAVACAVIFEGGTLTANSAQAATAITKSATAKVVAKTPAPVRLFYYTQNAAAQADLFAHPNSIDVLAPQTYSLDANGLLDGTINGDVLAFAAAHKIKVMPLVTNGSFSPSVAQAILNNPSTQAIAITSLVLEAKANGYWGWQLDFEQMDASQRGAFSAFVQNLETALHASGLELSVAVVPQVSQNPADYKNSLWQNLIGVYDYASLAAHSDFISLMSYDDPVSTGPVVEYPWLVKAVNYALTMIPASKLSMGIPLYYWRWNTSTAKLVDIGGNTSLDALIKTYHASASYSTSEQEPYLTYWYNKTEYIVWYENARSVQAKMTLISKDKLYGFSAWVLGLEDPTIYGVIGAGAK